MTHFNLERMDREKQVNEGYHVFVEKFDFRYHGTHKEPIRQIKLKISLCFLSVRSLPTLRIANIVKKKGKQNI